MLADVARILIAATASGVGKTTFTCGLLRALQRRGLRVQACKCGPDYIDPAFHRAVLGVPSRNLDLFLSDEHTVRELVATGGLQADITVIEGAMGYYDGIAQSSEASAFDVARVTHTPTVLMVDARGRSLSVAAEVAGFARFREPSHIVGVVLSRVSKGFYPRLKELVERETGLRVLGYIPEFGEATLQSRHLGLVEPDEVGELQDKIDTWASTLEQTVDMDALVALADAAPALEYKPRQLPAPCERRPLIAVARDEAFSFYYEDSLELLERLGAQLAYFSPLHDEALPERACGLYVGGGYPELHAAELSHSASMRASVRQAIVEGMPTIAECGGFMYLHATLEDEQGTAWPMSGAIDARAYPQKRMTRFGYVTLTAQHDALLAHAGQALPAHEFHYWESTHPGNAFRAQKPQSARGWDCVVSSPTLYAGFPHLYLYGAPWAAKRFVDACAAYGLHREVR